QLAKRLITVDEYHTMAEAGILTREDRVELIHGEILEMSPIGSKHAAIVNTMSNRLIRLLGDGVIISVQNPIRINDLTEPEPDLSLLKPKENYYADGHPAPNDTFIVIEISDSSYEYDKEVKLPLYASAGIPEYWIVNMDKKQIEVHTKPENGGYKSWQFFAIDDFITFDFCSTEIQVKKLIV
ncbi:MAG: Uma2 family endonuclease, partial [Bacteroidota bacterium]